MFTAEERQKYIGGSDISAVMGLNRWKTPLKLWAEKTGKVAPTDLSEVEAVQLGTELEEFVAQKFSRETGKPVRRQSKMYQHREYDYMVAHVDRLITGTDELLECKTCSFFKKEEWEGEEIPQEYILQVIWYLGITGRKTGYIACLIGGQKFVYKKIDFDEELFNQMVETAKDFWSSVIADELPKTILSNDVNTLNELITAPSSSDIEEVSEETNEEIERIKDLEETIKNIQVDIDNIKANLKIKIADKLGIKTSKYTITWKNETRKTLDSKALKLEEPEIAEKYQKETVSRVFRIKEVA